MEETLNLKHRDRSYALPLPPPETALDELAAEIARLTGIEPSTLKVLHRGKAVNKTNGPTTPFHLLGIKPGSTLMVLGSTSSDVHQIQSSRDMPGMAGFDHELKVLAARRRQSNAAIDRTPSGKYTFGSYEAWQQPGLRPDPAEALKLLHRLASDPGIVHIMEKHKWQVGKLSEMPPEGKVGISPVCILGVNINAGQEISLRLRTDDLKGFRRYLSIRETLCHELAHMVFGEHDSNFKQLNSQLRAECDKAASSSGQKLFEAASGWHLEGPQEMDAMRASAAYNGLTLRQMAERNPTSQTSVADGSRHNRHLEQEAVESSTFGVAALGHRDADTEAKEKQVELLSSSVQSHAAESPQTDNPDAPSREGGHPERISVHQAHHVEDVDMGRSRNIEDQQVDKEHSQKARGEVNSRQGPGQKDLDKTGDRTESGSQELNERQGKQEVVK